MPLNRYHKFSDDHYKHVTIVNDDSRGVIKWSFKHIDADRGVIYDRHMFIIQATDATGSNKIFCFDEQKCILQTLRKAKTIKLSMSSTICFVYLFSAALYELILALQQHTLFHSLPVVWNRLGNIHQHINTEHNCNKSNMFSCVPQICQ